MKYVAVSYCGNSVALYVPKETIYYLKRNCEGFFTFMEVEEQPKGIWIITVEQVLNDSKCQLITQQYQHLDEPQRKFLVDVDNKILQIVSPLSEEWLSQMVLRITRDALRNLGHDRMHYLHGAFMVYKNEGFAILGDKCSGKTTSVLNMAVFGNADFISNDDVSIAYENQEWIAYGWPRALSIRRDSIEAIKKLDGMFNEDVNLTHPYNYNDIKNESITFYPNEFSKYVGCKIRNRYPLNKVLFIRFGNENKLESMDEVIGVQRLNEQIQYDINQYFGELGKYFSPNILMKQKVKGSNIKYFSLIQNFSNLIKLPELLDEVIG